MPLERSLDRRLVGLPDADSRLAHELAAGVLRHGDALDALIAPFLHHGLGSTDARAMEILRIGGYQLRHLERVPAHAAVTTAVALTREQVGEHFTGFVNAVLRQVSDAARDEVAAARLDMATAMSHPTWLVERWLARFGTVETTQLLEWNNARAPLVVQPVATTIDALAEVFAAAGVRSFPAPFGAGLVVEESSPKALPGFAEGAFYVQDPAQALVVRFADVPPGATLYDACAAPGGKSIGLAPRAGLVIAGELARRRLPRLRENLHRTGRTHVRIVHADALHPPIRPVDAIILDAPCLGTGTFARHPDARLRVRPDALARLVDMQATLLDAAASRVRPGGMLCYSTCSLEPEENADQIERFLARRPEFHRERRTHLAGLPTNAAGDLELLPHRDGTDGGFASRLVRDHQIGG